MSEIHRNPFIKKRQSSSRWGITSDMKTTASFLDFHHTLVICATQWHFLQGRNPLALADLRVDL